MALHGLVSPGTFDLREQLRAIEVHLVSLDLAFTVQLDETDANDLQLLFSNGNSSQPLIEKSALQRNTFQLGPYPIRVVSQKFAKVSEQRSLPLYAIGDGGVKVEGIV